MRATAQSREKSYYDNEEVENQLCSTFSQPQYIGVRQRQRALALTHAHALCASSPSVNFAGKLISCLPSARDEPFILRPLCPRVWRRLRTNIIIVVGRRSEPPCYYFMRNR